MKNEMSDDERIRRGLDLFKKVHGDAVAPIKPGKGAYSDMALRNIYNDVWGREIMSIRDRRLAVIGALAAMSLWNSLEKHLLSALDLKELTWEELEELTIALSPYIGAPRTGDFTELVLRLKARK